MTLGIGVIGPDPTGKTTHVSSFSRLSRDQDWMGLDGTLPKVRDLVALVYESERAPGTPRLGAGAVCRYSADQRHPTPSPLPGGAGNLAQGGAGISRRHTRLGDGHNAWGDHRSHLNGVESFADGMVGRFLRREQVCGRYGNCRLYIPGNFQPASSL